LDKWNANSASDKQNRQLPILIFSTLTRIIRFAACQWRDDEFIVY